MPLQKRYFLLALIVGACLLLWAGSGPSRSSTQQDFKNPTYGEMEGGVRRLLDGSYLVASKVNMPGVSAQMVKWWFTDYLQTTEQYQRWHPTAHLWMAWEHKQPGQIVGAHHLVHEYLGGELAKLRIQFVAPADILGYDPSDENTSAVCARVGELEGWLNIAEMCHVARNTPWGAELRSRFWLGVVSDQQQRTLRNLLLDVAANNPLARRLAVDEETALALLQHASEEMSYLGALLPALYVSTTRPRAVPPAMVVR